MKVSNDSLEITIHQMIEKYIKRLKKAGLLYLDVYPLDIQTGKVALVRRSALQSSMVGEWQPVSGKVLEGERYLEAASRMMKDKLGAADVIIQKINFVNTFFDEAYDTVMFVPNFVALSSEKHPWTLNSDYYDEILWSYPSDAIKVVSWENQRMALNEILRYLEHL